MTLNIAVLISGNGSNLQALIDKFKKKDLINIKLVISNNINAYGIERAKKSGIETSIISHKLYKERNEYDRILNDILLENKIDIVCLAGFMRLLSSWFTKIWEGKLINIHPSLLPSFKGLNAIEQAYNYGVKITGCTVHFVNEEMDGGKIIAQEIVRIEDNDTILDLENKIHSLEHKIYPQALENLAKKILNNE